MTFKATLLASLLIAPAAMAQTVAPSLGEVSDANSVQDAVTRLTSDMASEVQNQVVLTSEQQQSFHDGAEAVLEASGRDIDHPQLIIAVDRNPAVQVAEVVLVNPVDDGWTIVGATHVSTGKPGRKEHFQTPVGVFENSPDNMGYRALGTFNENHIRGIGVKGMRVWDFGWQKTEDWRTPGATMLVRLEMHATDPANLEHRIGRPDSEGCVRIPSAMNRFLDRHGVLDALYLAGADDSPRLAALLPDDGDPTPLAGDLLVVFDSHQMPLD